MHVYYLRDAKGSELYTQPLIEERHDKGIPLTAKPLGFQRLDSWICGYHSLSLLHQLLQTDPNTDWGKFTIERMPQAFVTHVQDMVNNAPYFWGSIASPLSLMLQQLIIVRCIVSNIHWFSISPLAPRLILFALCSIVS